MDLQLIAMFDKDSVNLVFATVALKMSDYTYSVQNLNTVPIWIWELFKKILSPISKKCKIINDWTLEEKRRGLVLVLSTLFGLCFTFGLLFLVFIFQETCSFAEFIKFLIATVLSSENSLRYVLVLLIGIFPTFFVWRFRDQNKLKDIENVRKDTNLKDFHKLQEWASGIEQDKSKKNHTKNKKSEFANPLQVSAIHQLGGFFQGEFGEQFPRPAYELLHALWVNQFADIEDQLQQIEPSDDLASSKKKTKQNKKLILSKTRNPIAYAITAVVFGDGGMALQKLDQWRSKNYKNSTSLFKNRDWRGLRYNGKIELQKKNLYGINFSFAYLSYSHLNGADLRKADFNSARLRYANLSGAILFEADLSFADLSHAYLTNAALIHTNLQGTILLNLSSYTFKVEPDECRNANSAIFGFYKVNESMEIEIDWNETNHLRAQFGLTALTTAKEKKKLHKQINDYSEKVKQRKKRKKREKRAK